MARIAHSHRTSRYMTVLASLSLFGFAALPAPAAYGRDIDSLKDLKRSTWRSRYTISGTGDSIPADVILKGSKGVYVARNPDGSKMFLGKLRSVKYKKSGDKYHVRGSWSAQGQRGTFHFTLDVDDVEEFRGSYEADDGREGKWRGHYTSSIPVDPEAAQYLAGSDDEDDDSDES